MFSVYCPTREIGVSGLGFGRCWIFAFGRHLRVVFEGQRMLSLIGVLIRNELTIGHVVSKLLCFCIAVVAPYVGKNSWFSNGLGFVRCKALSGSFLKFEGVYCVMRARL